MPINKFISSNSWNLEINTAFTEKTVHIIKEMLAQTQTRRKEFYQRKIQKFRLT